MEDLKVNTADMGTIVRKAHDILRGGVAMLTRIPLATREDPASASDTKDGMSFDAM